MSYPCNKNASDCQQTFRSVEELNHHLETTACGGDTPRAGVEYDFYRQSLGNNGFTGLMRQPSEFTLATNIPGLTRQNSLIQPHIGTIIPQISLPRQESILQDINEICNMNDWQGFIFNDGVPFAQTELHTHTLFPETIDAPAGVDSIPPNIFPGLASNSSAMDLIAVAAEIESMKQPNRHRPKQKKRKKPSSNYATPVPTGVGTGQEFDKKVDVYEWEDTCLCLDSSVPQKCKYCDTTRGKPLYMTTKEHLHDKRCDKAGQPVKRGLQLKFNKYKNFTNRCCNPRGLALHQLIKYVQGKSGYKDAKTENQLNVTQEDALRAKGHLVSYGYRVIDYEEWSKTWPIKAAANPGMDGRGGSRNKDHDEAVAEKVRDFFDLGNNQKKRKVDHKQISQNLPEVVTKLFSEVVDRLGMAISKHHYHSLQSFDGTNTDLHADYFELQVADLHRQMGDFEKARSKTMMILSVLGSGDGKTTEAEKDFIDTARNQLCTIVREQSKLCLVDDPEDESLKKELDEHLRRLLMNLESNGRKTKVRRYAKYQMAEYHIERASIDDKKECNKHLKTMHKMLKEYEREMKLLVQHPTQSEYIVADGDPSTPNDTTSSSSSSSSSTSSSTSSSSSSSRGSRTSKSRTANKQVAYGSECDVHRQHCEYSIVKWEIKLNKMSDKEGIKRYEAMFTHRSQWFGEKHGLTVRMARKLGQHILKTTETTGNIKYKSMNKKQLMKWALDIMEGAWRNCELPQYRKKIKKDIALLKSRLQPRQVAVTKKKKASKNSRDPVMVNAVQPHLGVAVPDSAEMVQPQKVQQMEL